MKIKKCSKCKKEFPATPEYFSRDRRNKKWGLTFLCKKCMVSYSQKYRDNRKEYLKQYYDEHLDEKKEYDKKRRRDNKEFFKEYDKKYFQNNKKRKNKLQLERKKNDPEYKMACNMRSRLWQLFKNGNKKASHTTDMIGCTWKELRDHIESLFLDGMNWDNYGKTEDAWSLDHIKPCASFDLTDPEEQRKCFYHKNLQPMWNDRQWSKNSYYKGKYIRKNNT